MAPPYDVLSDADVEAYRSLSPYNVVRLTRPGSDYGGAARIFGGWLGDRILEPDPESMYVHEVAFDGRVRRDLIASLHLEDYASRVVLPHERTHQGAKEDRLALLRATRVALEPLWFLYEGNETGVPAMLDLVASGDPAVSFSGPGATRHKLWVVSDPGVQPRIQDLLSETPLLIADGHHRYETALAFAEEEGGGADAATRFTLALLTEMSDPGLVVLPTHRVVKGGVAVTGGEPAASLEDMLAALPGRVAAGAYRDGRFQVLLLEGEVPVVELHEQVIDNILGRRDPETSILYTRDPEEAVRLVDAGEGSAAFFLGPPDLRQVLRLAQEGKTLPQKATYFHPKPPSGMVFERLETKRRL